MIATEHGRKSPLKSSASKHLSSSASPKAAIGFADDEDIDMTSPEERLTSLAVRCVEFERDQQFGELVTARIHCLALAQLCFGKYDEEVTLAYCRLARAYLRDRLFLQAEAHSLHALERLACSEHENADVIRISALCTLGQAHVGARKYSKGLPMLEQALSLQRSQLGEDAADLDISEHAANELCELLQALATVYAHKKQFDRAVELLQEMRLRRERVLGQDHPDLLPVYVRLGKAHLAQSQPGLAEEALKRAVGLGIQAGSVATPEIGAALFGLASAAIALDRPQHALQHLQRALKVFRRVHGASSSHVLRTLRQMALVHVRLNEYTKAEIALNVCVKAERRVRGQSSPQLAELHVTRADVFTLNNEFSKAKAAFSNALQMYSRLHGPTHPKVLEMKSRIRRVDQLESGAAGGRGSNDANDSGGALGDRLHDDDDDATDAAAATDAFDTEMAQLGLL